MEIKANKFRILQLTDTHFGNLPEADDDIRTYKLLEKIILDTKPDLIIHTGDVMWSDGVKNADVVFTNVMKFIDQFDIPFALTFGNHDTEEIVTREDLRNIYEENIRNKPKKSDVFLTGDRQSYTINLEKGGELVTVLYMIDSGEFDRFGYGKYNWVLPEQVEWFRKVSDKYKKNDGIKRNVIFQHIPLPEYRDVVDDLLDGYCAEEDKTISAPFINTGLFANMVLNGETWGIVVGHDHDNNFDAVKYGVHLAYANSSGYQTYGDLPKGGSIIEISLDPYEIKKANVTYSDI